ncbi:MAG: hypothetical protein GDA41_03405 [Rhodospirillales bacterium]|nr:hypothetical protein [Rhodospirillales bacterium]
MTSADSVIVDHNEDMIALQRDLLDFTVQIVGLSIAELVGSLRRNNIPLNFSLANRISIQIQRMLPGSGKVLHRTEPCPCRPAGPDPASEIP